MELNLPTELLQALEREAQDAGRSLNEHLTQKLQSITPPVEAMDKAALKRGLKALVNFLQTVPAVTVMSSEVSKDAFWWVKLKIDLAHPLAWSVVQELGHVLNDDLGQRETAHRVQTRIATALSERRPTRVSGLGDRIQLQLHRPSLDCRRIARPHAPACG